MSWFAYLVFYHFKNTKTDNFRETGGIQNGFALDNCQDKNRHNLTVYVFPYCLRECILWVQTGCLLGQNTVNIILLTKKHLFLCSLKDVIFVLLLPSAYISALKWHRPGPWCTLTVMVCSVLGCSLPHLDISSVKSNTTDINSVSCTWPGPDRR